MLQIIMDKMKMNHPHPTFIDWPDRPSCSNCGKPCEADNDYKSGKIKWRDMCYDCHDHRTDQNYLATTFVGSSLPFSELESFARFN